MARDTRILSGRSREQKILEQTLRSNRSEFLALYGRRRVGKTFLIRRFFQDTSVTYFEMIGRYRGTIEDQLRIFSESVSETFHNGAQLAPATNWHDAFRTLRTAIEGRTRRKKTKVVLFLDELPWIATNRSGCLGELEHFWNAWCSRRDDIILIVSGSAASWMLRKIVKARGGLHDRLTRTIRLLPFLLPEVRGFFDDRGTRFTDRELIELYMIVGGVPHYLDQVERGHSIAQHVDRICLDKDGALHGEFPRLFASLFEDDKTYVDVVRALAKKRRGLTRKELLKAAGIPSGGGATTILENLEEGGFISVTIPFGRTWRDRFYQLTDEFCLFHLKWLAQRRPSTWQNVQATPRWQAWSGLAFESICSKHATAITRELGISGIESHVSGWLHADAQIDILIDRADGVITICEVKFTDAPFTIDKKYANELRNKIAVFREQTRTRKGIHFVFLTSFGVTPNRYSNELVDHTITMDALVR